MAVNYELRRSWKHEEPTLRYLPGVSENITENLPRISGLRIETLTRDLPYTNRTVNHYTANSTHACMQTHTKTYTHVSMAFSMFFISYFKAY
jgi:hypothetical protein